MDFARRAYDHSYRIDPIVRSLLDIDFYKLLMMQFIWERYPNVEVEWSVTNRTKSVLLANEIDINEVARQFDHARTLRFTESELVWLRGQSFYGQEGIFKPGFINALRKFRLPEYQLSEELGPMTTQEADAVNFGARGPVTGQLDIRFRAPWWQSTMWEIPALTIVNELRSRAALAKYNRSELDIIYARAKVKLYAKLELLAGVAGLNFSDFGTRRRHSFLWQEHCVLTAKEVIGIGFTGTSNVYLAMKHGLDPKGTNAHELQMVLTAMAMFNYLGDPDKVREAQYEFLRHWQNDYRGNLLICLPDTFGTTQFLKNAPQWLANWKGFRPDSKEPVAAGYEIIDFYKAQGLLPESIAREKLIVFSDGLDVEVNGRSNGADIIKLHREFDGKIGVGFGMGTNLTNDFIDCAPRDPDSLRAISLVCKVRSVDGHPAVKLSDNYDKATGPAAEVEAYRKIFGSEGMKNAPVLV